MVSHCAAAAALAALVPLWMCLHSQELQGLGSASSYSEPPNRQLRVVMSLDQGEALIIKDALVNSQTYLWITYSNQGDTPVNLTLLSYPSAAASACFAAEGYSLATLKKTTMADVSNSCALEPTELGNIPNNATMHSDVAVVLALVNRHALPVDITDLQLSSSVEHPVQRPPSPPSASSSGERGMPMASVYALSIAGLLLLVLGVAYMQRRHTRANDKDKATDDKDAPSV